MVLLQLWSTHEILTYWQLCSKCQILRLTSLVPVPFKLCITMIRLVRTLHLSLAFVQPMKTPLDLQVLHQNPETFHQEDLGYQHYGLGGGSIRKPQDPHPATRNIHYDKNEMIKQDNNNKNINTVRSGTSFPEILIFSFIGIFSFTILCLLCLGSKKCFDRFYEGRQRIRKALQYRPKSRATITPTPSPQTVTTSFQEANGNKENIFNIT